MAQLARASLEPAEPLTPLIRISLQNTLVKWRQLRVMKWFTCCRRTISMCARLSRYARCVRTARTRVHARKGKKGCFKWAGQSEEGSDLVLAGPMKKNP